ncbi:MAG TPA: CoA pyrophosphatase [Jatrophihabitans sp.]|jgi:8-oxo-dGTP pyrophosphatase MutT (NUDIX family)
MTEFVEDVPVPLRPLVEAVRTGVLGEFAGPRRPPAGVGRPSAVLVVFSPLPDGDLSVLLIERSVDMRKHPGQVAFPGGATDPEDADHIATALREAQEETGLDPAQVQVVGELPPLFIPRSGFVVIAVLAWWPTPVTLHPVDHGEVATVVAVPISALTDPANRFRYSHPMGFVGPAFEVSAATPDSQGAAAGGGLFIWGFTAAVLDRILEAGGWSRPWDAEILRPLPQNRL